MRLSEDTIKGLRNWKTLQKGAPPIMTDSPILRDMIDTIEALQRENEQLKRKKQDMFQEILRLSKSEPNYVQSYVSSFAVQDHNLVDVAEMEQLRAQVAADVQTLQKAREALNCLLFANIEGCDMQDMIAQKAITALAEIDKAIGGKEDV